MSTETVALQMGASPEHAVALEVTCIAWNLQDPVEKSAFLGQLHHETGGFKKFEENLNYSAARMAAVWPGRFAVPGTKQPNEHAKRLAFRPIDIANTVYAGRMGNNRPGDGWRYRGRGDPQLTGKANYTAYSKARYGDLRVVENPDLLLEHPDRSMAAGWFWVANGCGPWALKGDILAVSRIINLGNVNSKATPNGLDDRIRQTRRAQGLFNALKR